MTTPRPVAIVLGGTHPHLRLVENLKTRGYYVVLADYLESPPAKRVADEHERASTLDREAVLALARARGASLVIAACVDRANVTAAYVSERLGLHTPCSFAIADRIANKATMKQELVARGIPTADFRVMRSVAEADRLDLAFPVVIKPVDCGGSKGVRKAANGRELRRAAEEAFRISRCDVILAERFCEGVEVGADCFVRDQEAHILLLRRKYVGRGDAQAVLSSWASVAPAVVSAAAHERIRAAVADIARGFGLQTVPLLVQFIVDGDDVRVIEFAPRIGGGLNYRLVALQTGFDLIDASVDAWLGRCSSAAGSESRGMIASNHVYADACEFGELRNGQKLLDDGVIDELYVHRMPGATIGASFAASDRVASFIVRAVDADELLRRTRAAIETLDVLDVRGRSVIRRDLCLKAL